MAAPVASAAPVAASQGSNTKIKIQTYRGPVYDIDAEGCLTWGDLKEELRAMGSDPNSGEQKIWDDPSLGLYKHDKQSARTQPELKDTDKIEFGITVDLRPRPISVTVKEGDHTELLVVDKNMNVKKLREFFAQRRAERKQSASAPAAAFGGSEADSSIWTFEGKKLVDDQKLADLNLPSSGAVFRGRFALTVTDPACGIEDKLLASDSWTLEYLRAAYSEKRKRLILPNASWTIGPGEQPDDENETNRRADKKGPPLHDADSLYAQRITDEAVVRFENPPFVLYFRESGSTLADAKAEMYGSAKRPDDDTAAIAVAEIRDEWNVEQLKAHFNEHYAKTPLQLLGDDDRLVLRLKRGGGGGGAGGGDEVELEPTKELWKYVNLAADGAEIVIKREQLQQSSVRYICADCGEDVRLKKGDEVRCRQCGYRIVYKKRTTNPCQYLAR